MTRRRSLAGRLIVAGFGAGLAVAAVAQVAPSSAPPVPMTDPAPGGTRIDAGGVIGNWFPAGRGKASPAILLLGGSEGGLGAGATAMARLLQGEGFSILHLSYYRAPGQSPALALIPIETFDRALGWIARQPGVDRRRLAIVGGSKGAEAALLIASRHPELRAIVAGMPSSVVWPGIDWAGAETRSSWSAGGNPLQALPYGAFRPGGGIIDIYSDGLKALPRHPDTRIPVERIRARILLVCGERDGLWPSCPMARQITARVPGATLLAYPDAGHAVFGAPIAADNPARASLAQLGGTVDDNVAARADGWPKVVAFLRATLERTE